ncbi:GNAT family N-acetyltransferase [Nocardia sp. NPDC050378]|uniref:GNAT family N-acetyltransferase n=1 Tax=Nocardia sp. NPDC050378 TaxID=3155400 RepID=UPI00340143FD
MVDVERRMQIERATVDRPWWVVPGNDLLRAACGSGYISEKELRSIAVDDSSAIFIAHGSTGLVGLCIVAVAQETVQAQLTRTLSALESSETFPAAEPVGWLQAVVVDPAVRGQGIGDRSVKAGLKFLRQKHCRITYAVSWVSGTGQESGGMLTRNGFASLEWS